MKLTTFIIFALFLVLATLVLAGVLPEHLARPFRFTFGVMVLCMLAFVGLIHNSQKWQAQKKSLAEAEALQAQSQQPNHAPELRPDITPMFGTGIGDDDCDTVIRLTPSGSKSVIRPTAKPDADLELEVNI